MAKIVNGTLKTPRNSAGERYIIHPETDSSQVLVDNSGTTLETRLEDIDDDISGVVESLKAGDLSPLTYATDEEVEELLDEVFG